MDGIAAAFLRLAYVNAPTSVLYRIWSAPGGKLTATLFAAFWPNAQTASAETPIARPIDREIERYPHSGSEIHRANQSASSVGTKYSMLT